MVSGIKKIFLLVCLSFFAHEIFAINFSRGSETAQKFGVHEISLMGDGTVPNPFDVPCEVTFTSPSGLPVTVDAFYDGENTWHARCYIDETGTWLWKSVSSRDAGLDDKSGSFSAVHSDLRGKLKTHTENSKALTTENGEWFLNIGDTPYYIFHDDYNKWQEFIRDAWNMGVTLIRAGMIGALVEWNRLFENGDFDKMNIHNFQINDTRLIWMLDNYPDMYVELIMLPGCNTGWLSDETFWYNLSTAQHNRILKYMVARYAAFPEVMWQIVNDYKYSQSNPHNVEMANEVGEYLMNNDPWDNLITAGGIRGDDFYFPDADWATLFHLETLDALPADQVYNYTNYSAPVFCGEDRYETYKKPDHPAIYFRRLIWAWTLSGGSACYGGVWDDIVPYSESSLEGLDNIIHVKNFFMDNSIDLAEYFPDDDCVSSAARGAGRPKVMHTQTKSDFIIYHPNAANSGKGADISSGTTASLTINDLPAGEFTLLWMRADNGMTQKAYFNHSGGDKLLVSPWSGIDVVLYLHTGTVMGASISSMNGNDILSVQPNPFDVSTSIQVNLPVNTQMHLDIFNIQGRFVERLAVGKFTNGAYQFSWNANNQPVGIYIIKLKTESRAFSQRINLIR